ncbi:hypothetical protein [Streptomyces olivochromogenes]|uniref:hypothetical protein n=1 Tax=Streptomyces olivochromogenes TaxID=1963 RepID=UPI0027E43C1A|nr:hypothetical protein [Streptomyces olivochromogenes]
MTGVVYAMGRGILAVASRSPARNASVAEASDRPRGVAAYTARAGACSSSTGSRMTFEVPRLFRPKALVEIEIVAAVPGGR